MHPVSIAGPTGPVTLKWHRLKLTAADAPFRRDRLAAGLAAGAVLEIDLQRVADGFVVLHDDDLDTETNGTGPVAGETVASVTRLTVRGIGGQAPMDLADLARQLAAAGPLNGGHLQLDLKLQTEDLADGRQRELVAALRPHADHLVLSGYDWSVVAGLAGDLPGATAGFDPLDYAKAHPPATVADWHRLVDWTRQAAPGARWIYLHHRLVTDARAAGVDIVAPFHAAGALVDAWTVDARPDWDWQDTVRRLLDAGVDQISSNTAEAIAAAFA